ncbi:hypothetical protein [Acidithiobacillus ferrooxidans]|uniref:Uncharacterized protein n=1 Tax=Acidithiobacillus ferrooxidans TaxID=920 RepID=A0A2W1KJ15_ACIFR|nr:hypothetical protein [Acidithiobacillus ferrooxidans]MBU2816196.1 hypothetical protein [Acidithiobacillus ferrooxidans]MCR1343994.1 hypothetical protein [Acidithiobacillus ferrooxidans]PZD82372.1 hypothetical protein DN052_04970 [Acidithiobacillus ferrooxidans]QLK41354.1 hypothetical protein FE661_03595 [Acidithiobacillus ferrooxidans]QZT53296.1 hypothetical protein K7B00_03595 [Acidithiobacillus ferrooxidans]
MKTMKKSDLVIPVVLILALVATLPGVSFAGLTYTPVAPHGKPAPRLAGLAVQCVPIKGDKPGVRHKGPNTVTLLCKPQYLHMRGIEASKANLKLLFAGKGYDAALKVYKLKYATIGNGKVLQGTEKVGVTQ